MSYDDLKWDEPTMARIARKVLRELELVGQQWGNFGPSEAERIGVAIAYSIGRFARGAPAEGARCARCVAPRAPLPCPICGAAR